MKKIIIVIVFSLLAPTAWASIHYMHSMSGAPSGGALPSSSDALLLETGDYLLLESGDKLLLE